MINQDNIELTIIGIILRNPKKIIEESIESRWFSTYRKVIIEMQRMSSEGIDIDAIELYERLKDYDLATVVHWQTETYGSEYNFSGYVKKLKEIYINSGIHREFVLATKKIENKEETKSVLFDFITKINGIESADAKNFNFNMNEALLKFTDEFTNAFETDGKIGLELGIKTIDDALGGYLPTDLMIVGARPAVGKTAFALTVIRNLAMHGKNIGFFSTEMGVTQVMQRLITMGTHINSIKLRKANVDESEIKRITATASAMTKYNLRIYDKPSITANEIMMQSRSWHMFEPLDFIVVDYLTRIRPDKDFKNQNLAVGETVTVMKNIARVLNVPVMVLAQLNRDSDKRAEKRPIMSDLRDSGIIEQEADQILLLHRHKNDSSEQPQSNFADRYAKKPAQDFSQKLDEIIIDKNRHGETGIFNVKFEKELAMWVDYEKSYR